MSKPLINSRNQHRRRTGTKGRYHRFFKAFDISNFIEKIWGQSVNGELDFAIYALLFIQSLFLPLIYLVFERSDELTVAYFLRQKRLKQNN